MRWVSAFLYTVIVYLLRGKEASYVLILLFQNPVIICQFVWEGNCTYDFDLTIFVDENVRRMDIADFPMKMFKFATCSYNIVK